MSCGSQLVGLKDDIHLHWFNVQMQKKPGDGYVYLPSDEIKAIIDKGEEALRELTNCAPEHPKKERIAAAEAKKLTIPSVGLLDTNCDPDEVDYVIPGNDDAIKAIKLFASKIADACIEGKRRYEERIQVESIKQAEETDEKASPVSEEDRDRDGD
jgi:hypothetical protein